MRYFLILGTTVFLWGFTGVKEKHKPLRQVALWANLHGQQVLNKLPAEKFEGSAFTRDSLEKHIVAIANHKHHIKHGHKLFLANCSPCHGKSGEGMIGPNLTDEYWLHGGKTENIVASIVRGIPDKGMASFGNRLTAHQIGHIVSYIHSIQGSNPPDAKGKQGKKA